MTEKRILAQPTDCLVGLIATGAIKHAAWTAGEMHLSPWRFDLSWFQMHSVDVMLTAATVLITFLSLVLGLRQLMMGALLCMTKIRWSPRYPEHAKVLLLV